MIKLIDKGKSKETKNNQSNQAMKLQSRQIRDVGLAGWPLYIKHCFSDRVCTECTHTAIAVVVGRQQRKTLALLLRLEVHAAARPARPAACEMI